jgi:CRISPR-associated protein Csb1
VETISIYERLERAMYERSDDAAIRVRACYEPAAGQAAKVSPPTYPVEGRESPYLFETRHHRDGQKQTTVLLDSRQSQANRCEEALAQLVEHKTDPIPHLVLKVETNGRHLRITSLTAPHRSRDAYFRDSQTEDGTVFDETEVGKQLASCTPEDASAFYKWAPTDLVYGVWDSHRGLRLAARFPRIYTSEMVGWDPIEGVRAAGRYDLITSGAQKVSVKEGRTWQLGPNGKKKLSELGLGSIPPTTRNIQGQPAPGGVSVSEIERLAVLSFPALTRIRLGEDPEVARSGRLVLASLALLGDRLAFDGPGLFLRSGCDLIKLSEEVSWVKRGGTSESFTLDKYSALDLFRYSVERAAEKGLVWEKDPIYLRAQENLQGAINNAFYSGLEERQED